MKLELALIIFDFDGVVIDSGADIAKAVNYTLKHFKRNQLPEEEIISYVGHGAERLIRSSFKEVTDELVAEAMSLYLEYYLAHCLEETKLYNHFKETLEFFKDKKKAIVTNKPESLTVKILQELSILDYFDLIVGPESVTALKPNPEGLLKVLTVLGIGPEAAMMIGDSYTDIEVGKIAGMHTCGVTYGLGDKNKLILSSPDILIDDINKLKDFIE